MRIYGNQPRPLMETKGSKANKAEGGDAPAVHKEGAVVVAERARAIGSVTSAHRAHMAVRIAEIRAKIESGSYRIDSQKLAESIVDDELARSGGRR